VSPTRRCVTIEPGLPTIPTRTRKGVPMKPRLIAALAAALTLIGLAAPADAVTNGQPDNGAHP
jgi:hypothetical protein